MHPPTDGHRGSILRPTDPASQEAACHAVAARYPGGLTSTLNITTSGLHQPHTVEGAQRMTMPDEPMPAETTTSTPVFSTPTMSNDETPDMDGDADDNLPFEGERTISLPSAP